MTLGVEHVAHAVIGSLEKAVVHVKEYPAPFAAGHFVGADVARVGIGKEYLEGQIVHQVVDVDIVLEELDVFQVVFGVQRFDLFHQLLPLLIGAVVSLVIGLNDVHVIRFFKRDPLMLGHEIAADALTQVIVPPVLAVDVDDHRLPGLVDDGGVRDLVDQAALQAVDQAGPNGVVAADSQNQRFVLLKGPVGKDGGVEVALAQTGLGDQLQ